MDTIELSCFLARKYQEIGVESLPLFIQFGYQKLPLDRVYATKEGVFLMPEGTSPYKQDDAA